MEGRGNFQKSTRFGDQSDGAGKKKKGENFRMNQRMRFCVSVAGDVITGSSLFLSEINFPST